MATLSQAMTEQHWTAPLKFTLENGENKCCEYKQFGIEIEVITREFSFPSQVKVQEKLDTQERMV